MDKPRNKARAPGMDFLGVPMPKSIKEKIRQAASIKRRTMADWARIELEDAAKAIIAQSSKPIPLDIHSAESMVADTRDHPPPLTSLQTTKKTRYPRGVRKPPMPSADEKQA